jgi:hypothetical protein
VSPELAEIEAVKLGWFTTYRRSAPFKSIPPVENALTEETKAQMLCAGYFTL